MHDSLRVGDLVEIGGPRNNFPLIPADRYLFVAGGIGITPIMPMIREVELLGANWSLLYGGRMRASMAFVDELATFGNRVQLVPQDELGLLDLASFLGEPRSGTPVYCCGPAPLLAALENATAGWPSHAVRTERFVAREAAAPVRDTSFEVVLARTGRTLTIMPERGLTAGPSPRRGLPAARSPARYQPVGELANTADFSGDDVSGPHELLR